MGNLVINKLFYYVESVLWVYKKELWGLEGEISYGLELWFFFYLFSLFSNNIVGYLYMWYVYYVLMLLRIIYFVYLLVIILILLLGLR